MKRRGLAFELTIYALAAASFLAGAANETRIATPYEPGPRESGVLRVVTWNVGEGMRQDGAGLSEMGIEHIAGVLRELDPDLCFLQEVNSAQGRRLLEALGPGWTLELSGGSSMRRVAALGQRGALEPFDVEDAGLRALGVVYRWGEGVAVAAVGLHANAFSARDRNQEIGAATESLYANASARGRILAGDLNLDLDLDKRRDLFTDDEYLDVETYNFVSQRLLDAARGRGATAEPDRRLDYLFVSPDAFEVRDAGPWLDRRGAGMDHDPVVADLVLRDE